VRQGKGDVVQCTGLSGGWRWSRHAGRNLFVNNCGWCCCTVAILVEEASGFRSASLRIVLLGTRLANGGLRADVGAIGISFKFLGTLPFSSSFPFSFYLGRGLALGYPSLECFLLSNGSKKRTMAILHRLVPQSVS
jgi:hypothetical protein